MHIPHVQPAIISKLMSINEKDTIIIKEETNISSQSFCIIFTAPK
jgi:hypothetical protein